MLVLACLIDRYPMIDFLMRYPAARRLLISHHTEINPKRQINTTQRKKVVTILYIHYSHTPHLLPSQQFI